MAGESYKSWHGVEILQVRAKKEHKHNHKHVATFVGEGPLLIVTSKLYRCKCGDEILKITNIKKKNR